MTVIQMIRKQQKEIRSIRRELNTLGNQLDQAIPEANYWYDFDKLDKVLYRVQYQFQELDNEIPGWMVYPSQKQLMCTCTETKMCRRCAMVAPF